MNRQPIGKIIGGGYQSNLKVDLNISSEDVQIGNFVMIEGGQNEYFGMITDLSHESNNPGYIRRPGRDRLPSHLSDQLEAEMLNCGAEITVSLARKMASNPSQQLRPARTIPPPLSTVYMANCEDIENVFGREDSDHFIIGYHRDQEIAIPINLRKLLLRSSGVFGATGTGKSFLVRLVLAGLIDRNLASVLILDPHSEYGLSDVATDTGERVPGLKRLFPNKVLVYSLGYGSRVRGIMPDRCLEISLEDIQMEDLQLLEGALDMPPTASMVLDALTRHFGREHWLRKFMAMRHGLADHGSNDTTETVAGWAKSVGINSRSAEALHNRLQRLVNRPYIVNQPRQEGISGILRSLESGQSVVLSFGEYVRDLDYLLVSNLLSRKLRAAWERRSEHYRSTQLDEPNPLVIVVEEAHQFMGRHISSQSEFATIAREMRKNQVILLVVDQRPSQLDETVLSQIGTRICGWMGDDDDLHAVLIGLAGRDRLRKLLSDLQPSQEALILGWGVPIPVPIRTRRYDESIVSSLSSP